MHLHCYFGAPLIARGHAAEALATLWRWLAAQSPSPSLLDLPTLPAEGPIHQELTDFVHSRRMLLHPYELYTRALLRRSDSAIRYQYECIPGDERRLLRQKHRKLSSAGKLEVRAVSHGDDLDDWLERFLLLEASGWKGRLGTALNLSPADREYFLTISREAFLRDRLLLVTMTLDGRLVAAHHSIRAQDGAFAMRTVYDEQFHRCSPGMLVEAEIIRLLHEQQCCRWIDSCCAPGNSAMKRLWRQRRAITGFLCPVNWRGDLLVSTLPMLRYGRRLLRSLMPRKPC
jgi:CelD/BcsL family acetyltransferase involved in cellulose biosynthesis